MVDKVEMKNHDKSSNNKRQFRKKIKSFAMWFFYCFFSFYLLIWLTSPVIARYFLKDILMEDYGIVLAENTSIRFNPFTSHLSIRGLLLHKNEKLVFRLNHLDVEVRLHRLLLKQLYFSEVKVNNFFALIEKNAITEVAGFTINQEFTDNHLNANSLDNKEKITKVKSETFEIEIVIPEIDFVDGNVKLLHDSMNHQLAIEKINFVDVFVSQKKQIMRATVLANSGHANINFDVNLSLVDSLGDIEMKVAMSGYELKNIEKLLPKSIKHIDGKMNFNSNQSISFLNDKINLKNSQSKLSLNDFELITDSIKLSQQKQNISLSNLELNLLEANEKFELKIGQLEFKGENTHSELADLKIINKDQSILVNDFSLMSGVNKLFNGTIRQANIKVDNFQSINNTVDFTTKGMGVAFSELNFSPENFELETITLNGFNGLLRILGTKPLVVENTDSLLVNHKLSASDMSSKKVQPVAESSHSDMNKTIQPSIKINKALLSNTKNFVFIDESVSPKYKREILFDELAIEKIDSKLPDQESLFVIKGHSEEYTKFNFSGFVKPFTEKVNLTLHGKMNEVSLPPASSYVRSVMGFQFKSGELDTSLDLVIKDSQIKGHTDIKIRGLGLETIENYEQNILRAQTAMPLNVALDMLKDDDDNLELNIPIQGDVDNPSFGISTFINLVTKKAIQSAATSYLLNTFVPYAKLVSVTISATDFIMKTRFENLIYQAEQTEIDEQQIDYLNQFVALMTEKNKTSVKVCAISSTIDLGAKVEKLVTEKDKIEYLMEVSNKRMLAFKKYAVSKNVESSRILLCSPKVDINEKQASQPRIEISV